MFNNVTVDSIRKTLDSALFAAAIVARFTPGQLDDQLVASIRATLQQDWIWKLVEEVLKQPGEKPTADQLVAAVRRHLA